ncbi:location of vulva defective 1 [Daphnia magna]|uniref:location of vulva defective 1 n=1 Tax=Daphnia magna TaxID=35525 RepID=UPI001E1BA4F0|nr:location of vulva defective 1 [Daphnia magna]
MKLLLVILLVSGLLIGESQAQGPFVRFFGNLYLNLRNTIRNAIGITSTSTVVSSTTIQTTVTVTVVPPPDVAEEETNEEILIDFPILINSQLETMDTGPTSESEVSTTTESEVSTTTESGSDATTQSSLESTTEEVIIKKVPIIVDAVSDLPDLSTINAEVETSTINTELEISTTDPQVDPTTPFPEKDNIEQEINTEMPKLDPGDISAMEAMVETLLQTPTTTVASPTTPQDVPDTTETEPPVVVKVVQPVKIIPTEVSSTTTSSSTQSVRTSTTFSTLAPKRTIHFTRPSWTPTFLKLANRNIASSRYFFPAHFRRPKGEDFGIDVQEDDNIFLKPSRVLPVESSIGPQMPYVVKRHVTIESSLRASQQQQRKTVLVTTATTD